MNKGRRNELTKLKHKKRCKNLGIIPEENYCYKHQGKPCSCFVCSGNKYNRAKSKKNQYE